MTYRMFITRCFLLLTSFLLSFQFAFSQEVGSSGAKTINGVDLKSEKKNSVSVNGKQVEKNNGTNPVPFATCGDMGAENGWSTWQSSEGYHQLGTNGDLPIFFAPGAPATMAPRFAITSGAGNDACSVGAGPLVPVVAPGFGNSSILIGQPLTNGIQGNCASNPPYPAPGGGAQGNGCSEQLQFSFTVSAQDINFIYAYAVFVENPPSGHTLNQAPFTEIYILAPNNIDTVPCSKQRYTADLAGGIGPGFYASNCSPTSNGVVTYKPWTLVGVNLTNYVGQTLKTVITNTDCALGGHSCWSYWDFSCGALGGSPPAYCLGQSVTLNAPNDPLINYTYQWTHNGSPYTGPPSATSPSITPTPAVGDTFIVLVHQPSGCDFKIPYVPKPNNAIANFHFATSCSGVTTFTDSSYVPIGGGTITGYNWTFPSGNPATATTPTASVTFPPGTHTVTLNVTSSTGCNGTKTLTFTTNNAVAAFNTGPVCLGTTTTFINTSTASTSDPISSWDWNFGDGTPHATIQSPSHVYATSGTYTVTQIITTQAGCKDSVKLPITVNPLPQAAFTSNTICAGTVSSLTDNSILPAGETITWSWNLSGGTPATSTAQNPSVSFPTGGTYTVSEIVTTQFGCSDTTVLPVIVNAIPQAAFSSNTVCAGNVTSLTDNSTSPSTGGAITSWSWNFPSGNPSTSTTQNPIVTFPAGIYNVTLVITAQNSCTNTTILPVAIYGLPIANFSSNSPCIGNATNFVDLSVSPSGDNITSWSWNMAGGTPAASAITNPFTIYNTPGTYTATLTVTTQGGCKDTISHPVTVFAPPVANFSGSGVGCAPICVTNYKDSSTTLVGNNIVSWQWSFPGGSPASYITNNSPGNPSSICYNSPGAFGASLIVTTANGCKDSISINPVANVYPLPKSSFCILSNPVPVTDPVFSFCDQWSNDVVQWVWTFGDGDSASNIVNPVHSYSATATNNDFYTYNVCLNVKNQFGCWDSVCHVVELLPEFTFYISNSFTPNGDGNNDFFFGKGRGIKDYNIWVFDRWGNDIWDCHYSGKNTDWDNTNQDGMPSACKWDGVVVKGGMDMSGGSGKVVQEDVYVWKVKLTDVFDKAHTYIGRVSVVK